MNMVRVNQNNELKVVKMLHTGEANLSHPM